MKTKLHSLIIIGLCYGGLPLPGATNIVQIRSYYFTPTNLNINVGDTVLWTNAAAITHDTTSTNAAFPWASGDLTGANKTFALKFTNAGTYFYVCFQHFFAIMNPHHEQTGNVVVASINLPPSVSLTNPAGNARFLAPANIPLQADASDNGGSVTNVQFYSGDVPVGADNGAPYQFTVSNVPAGNYTFTARATDNLGTMATSAPVSVFVLTNAFLTDAARLGDGRFRLTVQGIAGQTYTMESSTNVQNWLSFQTNVAPASTFNVTDSTSTNVLRRHYRARQEL